MPYFILGGRTVSRAIERIDLEIRHELYHGVPAVFSQGASYITLSRMSAIVISNVRDGMSMDDLSSVPKYDNKMSHTRTHTYVYKTGFYLLQGV